MSARAAYRVVVAGGGIAGAEALLAVRELAGDLVALTLVEPRGELRLHVLEPGAAFAIGDAGRLRVADIASAARAEVVRSALEHVDVEGRSIRTREGERIHCDALLVAVGSSAVPSVRGAVSWLPAPGTATSPQLLADAETGRVRRVAFLVPTRCPWPLPAYELALMTARRLKRTRAPAALRLTTPEPAPLAIFGAVGSSAVGRELDDAGVGGPGDRPERSRARRLGALLAAHDEPGGLRLAGTRLTT